MSNTLNLAQFLTLTGSILVTLSPLAYLGVMFAKDYRSDKQRKMLMAFKHEFSRYRSSQEIAPGKIRLLEFCIEAEVDAKVGKRFLEKKVEEFAGIVDVDQFGDVVYFFGDSKGKFLESHEE